jgi:hypothetical protein
MAQENSRASGSRRVTLEMRTWLDRADSFKGLPPGTAKLLTFLYAFKEAEPYLGLPPHTYKLVDWLEQFTKRVGRPVKVERALSHTIYQSTSHMPG